MTRELVARATNPVAKIVEGWILEFQALVGQTQPEGAAFSAPEVLP